MRKTKKNFFEILEKNYRMFHEKLIGNSCEKFLRKTEVEIREISWKILGKFEKNISGEITRKILLLQTCNLEK